MKNKDKKKLKKEKEKKAKKKSGVKPQQRVNQSNLWVHSIDEINSQFSKFKNKYFLPRFLRQMKKLNTGSLSGGNSVTVITDGDICFNQFIKCIKTAKISINLETYIFNSDEIGWEIARLLVNKAKRGVEVNLIYDAWGCITTSTSLFSFMREGGVEILEYHPFLPWKKYWNLGLRDHRKILVIDGKTAFLGGNNISNEYAGKKFSGDQWLSLIHI